MTNIAKAKSYREQEERVREACLAVQNNQFPSARRAALAFDVPARRVQRRLVGKKSKSSRIPSNKALSEEQELAIREYVSSLDNIEVLPARLSVMVRGAANYLLWEAHTDPTQAPRSVSTEWAKRFMARNPKLCKHQTEFVVTKGETLVADGSVVEGGSLGMGVDMVGHGEQIVGDDTIQELLGGYEGGLASGATDGTDVPPVEQPTATEAPGLEAEGSMLDTIVSEPPSMVEVEQKSSADKINHFGFRRALDRYASLIAHLSGPSTPHKSKEGQTSSTNLTLQGLDDLRLHSLPAELESEERASAPFLLRDEVESLLRWKLKHGTFRPRLMELVQMNEPAAVFNVTKSAFKTYEENPEDYVAALKELVSLTGIGPATASLLLSVYDPSNVPFFSDEGFRWIMFEESPGKGWDRKIKYDLKEYQAYFGKVKELKERLAKQSGEHVKAVDVEKVGFVLGKEAAGVIVGANDPDHGIGTDTETEDKEEPEISPPPLKKKRGRPPSAKAQLTQSSKKKGPEVNSKKAPKLATKRQKSGKVNSVVDLPAEGTIRVKRPRRA